MPYKAGSRLPGEYASKLGHLEVVRSPLVRSLVQSYEDTSTPSGCPIGVWQPIPTGGTSLPLVFGVDGSLQVVEAPRPPHKALAFVKTALLRLDQPAMRALDPQSPHPMALRDIMSDSALYHATVFPLRHVTVPGVSVYHSVRRVIFESIKDESLRAEPLETLKWLAFQKWSGERSSLPAFECPHCDKTVATLPYDAEEGECIACGGHLYISDMLGFHQEMASDSAPDSVASAYMAVHETLLLFTAVRYYWEHNREVLKRCLLVKDGPLSIRAQYSKLVNPIRRFVEHASGLGISVHMVGQEKSGRFYEHLQLIAPHAPVARLFIPDDRYVKEHVQHRPDRGAPYGKDTNYGAKVFVKLDDFHHMVLSIPTGSYQQSPLLTDLVGAADIFATLPAILSNRFEGALLPVELAHGVASLSTYPSAHILKIFADTVGHREQ